MTFSFRRFGRRVLVVGAVFSLVVGASLVIAPLRRAIWEPLARVGAEQGLVAALGGEATVQGVAWADGGVEIDGLAWKAAEGPARIALRHARADVTLSKLVRGSLSGLRRVEIDGLDVVWVLEPGPEEEEEEGPPGPPAPFELRLPALPEVVLANVSVDVRASSWNVIAKELAAEFVHTDPGEGEVLAGSGNRAVATATRLVFTTGATSIVDGPFTLRARLDPDDWEVLELVAGGDLAATAKLRASAGDGLLGEANLTLEKVNIGVTLDWASAGLGGTVELQPLALNELPQRVPAPSGLTGTVELNADLNWPAGHSWTDAKLDATLGLEDFLGFGVSATTARLVSTAVDGAWGVTLDAPELNFADGLPRVAAELRASWVDGLITLEELLVTSGAGSKIRAEGTLPFAFGATVAASENELRLILTGEVPDVSEWPVGKLAGAALLAVEVAGSLSQPTASIDIDIDGARWDASPKGVVSARVRVDERVSIERLSVELPEFALLSANGTWALDPSLDGWRSESPPDWRVAAIDAELSLDAPDLGRWPLRSQALRRIAGSLEVDGSLAGSIAELRYRGSGQLTGGRLDFLSDVPSLSDIELQFELEQDRAVVSRGSATSGGAPLELSGSYAFGATPQRIEAAIKGDNLLFSRSRDALLRGDVDVQIAGALEQLEVTGKLNVTSGILASRIEVMSLLESGTPSVSEGGIGLFSLREPPLSNMRFDLAVTSERPISIENNVLTARITPDLRLRGTGEVPELVGTVYVNAAAISLPAATLRVRRGTVRFDPANPFVPDLALEANSKRLGYDISVVVQGPYDAPEISFNSVPPLASEDILVLLLTGQLPKEAGSRAGRSEAGQTVALYFGKDLLAKWFASDDPLSDEESFFERFDFVTGQEISRQGVPTIEASFRLREELWEPEDRLLLTLERDVWEDYNMGLRWVVRLR